MTEPIAYVNGEFVPESRAAVSILDHGLLYGDGVFETVLTRNGAVHRPDAHLDRLFRSLAAVHIPPPHDRAGLAGIIAEATRRNDLADAYVKLIVTRGTNGTPLLDPRGCEPGVICLVRPHTTPTRPAPSASATACASRRPPSAGHPPTCSTRGSGAGTTSTSCSPGWRPDPAASAKRSEDRTNSRNGYRAREWDTRGRHGRAGRPQAAAG